MTSERGKIKQDVMRAKHNADRIVERLSYMPALYEDYTEFSDGIKDCFVFAAMLSDTISNLLEQVP